MSSDFKSGKCLEWCTKLPGLDGQVESPIFSLKSCLCLFSLALKKEEFDLWYYVLYIELKSGDLKGKPCDVVTQIGFKKQQILRLDRKAFTISGERKKDIWRMKMGSLQGNVPSDYVNGNWIKFRFCFNDVAETFLTHKKQMENKCLQTSAHLNADVPVTSLIKDLTHLLDTGENHDAEIRCGECSIKTHRTILCARSEVLKAMLKSEMVEGRTGVVEIQDMDATCIQDFVRYLYTEKVPELTFEKAKALYRAGDKYAVRSLVLRCSEYFQDNLSPENAFECLALADAHSDEKLIDSVIAFSLENKMYLQDDFWSPFCERYPNVVVKAYRLLHKSDTDRKKI